MSRCCSRKEGGITVEGLPNASASDQVRLQGEKPDLPRQEAAGELKLILTVWQIVLRLDEASLVGAKQAGLLQAVQDFQARGTCL